MFLLLQLHSTTFADWLWGLQKISQQVFSICQKKKDKYVSVSELLTEMRLTKIKVESDLYLECQNFVYDVLQAIDELQSPQGVMQLWHVPLELATNVFSLVHEVIFEADLDYQDKSDSDLSEFSDKSSKESSESEEEYENTEESSGDSSE